MLFPLLNHPCMYILEFSGSWLALLRKKTNVIRILPSVHLVVFYGKRVTKSFPFAKGIDLGLLQNENSFIRKKKKKTNWGSKSTSPYRLKIKASYKPGFWGFSVSRLSRAQRSRHRRASPRERISFCQEQEALLLNSPCGRSVIILHSFYKSFNEGGRV